MWVKTKTGASMPLEASSSTTTARRVVLYDATGARLAAGDGVERTGYAPHWATCTEREKFKRAKR